MVNLSTRSIAIPRVRQIIVSTCIILNFVRICEKSPIENDTEKTVKVEAATRRMYIAIERYFTRQPLDRAVSVNEISEIVIEIISSVCFSNHFTS